MPLLFFGASARRLPMTTIGLLHTSRPFLQFIVALVVFKEAMTADRWIGFGVVWLALLVLTVDMLWTARRNSAARKAGRRRRIAPQFGGDHLGAAKLGPITWVRSLGSAVR